MERDSLRDAGIYFTTARQEAPTDPTPRRALGDFYVKRGTFELAVPEYEAALAMDTSDVELRFGLGRSLYYAQRYNEALDRYREVVGRDPEYAAAQLALGDLLYRAGVGQNVKERFEEARAPLEKYVSQQPEDARGWSVLGRDLAMLSKAANGSQFQEPAMAALNKAESLGDKTKETYTVRARLYAARKECDKALADYAKGEPQAQDQLIIAQCQAIKSGAAGGSGVSGAAESTYVAIIGRDSTSKSALFAMNEIGKSRFRAKDYDGAIGAFSRRIALDPSNDEAYYYRGLSHKEMKRYTESLADLEKAAELAPTKADRWFWVGILHAQLEKREGARTSFGKVVELDTTGTNKNVGIAHQQLGYYDLLEKKYSAAITHLKRATEIDATNVQAWVWLGQGYQNSGDRAKACEAYGRALSIKPNQPDALKGKAALKC
jgi:tetratricopeptide (TPR) repeat protein